MKRHNDDKVSKTEKKRRKEQRVVEEMIKLYCSKNHPSYKESNTMCQECRYYQIMQSKGVSIARSWSRRRFVQIAQYTAINQK